MPDNEEIKVKEHTRKKPGSSGKKGHVSDPQETAERAAEGVEVLGGGGKMGVKTLSSREPGQLQTQVEIGVPDADRDDEGRRKFLRG